MEEDFRRGRNGRHTRIRMGHSTGEVVPLKTAKLAKRYDIVFLMASLETRCHFPHAPVGQTERITALGIVFFELRAKMGGGRTYWTS